ncbi:MAG: hypothetical protein RIE32_08050 [Phycisphaerales bacterium]
MTIRALGWAERTLGGRILGALTGAIRLAMTRRHRMLTWRMVLAALLVGVVLAVVSVPVAAVIAANTRNSGPGLMGFYLGADHVVLVYKFEHPASVRWLSNCYPPDDVFDAKPGDPRPAFARTRYTASADRVECWRAGWPAIAAQGRIVTRYGEASAKHSQGLLAATLAGKDIAFPWRPIWPGLLANTLFYAALALTPMALLRWRRTRRRRARGLCVACGYALGERVSACPECGLESRPS